MEAFRQIWVIKSVVLVTACSFLIASLSVDFMFGVLGVSNDALVYEYFYQTCFVGADAIGWKIEDRKEAGAFALMVLLLLTAIVYGIYRLVKAVFGPYKTGRTLFR